MMTSVTNFANEAAHSASTLWTPRLIRCKRCGSLAHVEARERIDADDVAVRFVCDQCRWGQTRHYHDSEFTHRMN